MYASTLNNRTSVAHHLGKARNDSKPLWSKIIKTTDTNRNNMMRKNKKKKKNIAECTRNIFYMKTPRILCTMSAARLHSRYFSQY